jgi:uncharacterized membrane protein
MVTGGFVLGPVPVTRPEDAIVFMALIVGLRALVSPYALPDVDPRRAVAVGIATYILLMGTIVVTRHWALRTHALDLGQPVQVLWNILRGAGPELTQIPGFVSGDRMSRWGDHFEPILYVLTPVAWLWPGAESLLLQQTVGLAAGAVFAYGYARHRIGISAAAAFALLYLLNPSLHGINLRDMHPAAFVIPCILAAAWAWDRGRYVWCAVALVLTLACREDAALAVVGFGIWLALARGRWAVGAAVAVVAVLVLFVDLHYVIPYYRNEGKPYNHLYRYEHLGGSLREILTTILVRPWRWIPVLFTGPKMVYLAALLAPLGFLAIFAPRAALAAAPGLALTILSNDYRLYNFRSQYQAFILPFLVLAAVEGYRKLRAREEARETDGRRLSTGLLGFAFVASVVLASPVFNDLGVNKWRLGPMQQAAYRLMGRIPSDAAVSSNERLAPHMSLRRDIWVFPYGVPQAQYVLDLANIEPKLPPGVYREVARDDPWVLWQRD